MIDKYLGLTDAGALIAFEKFIGWRLPGDYREFIEKYNGGRVRPNGRYINDINVSVCVDVLFGLSVKMDLDIKEWHRLCGDDLPRDAVIIGGDMIGNLFVLSLLDKIYYWDHLRRIDISTDSANAYLVSDGFRRFLDSGVGHREDIQGPRGPKLVESIWQEVGRGKIQEVNRRVYVEFARREGFALFGGRRL